MKFDLKILNSYLERDLIEKNPHPTLPIDIWNYTRKCQYSNSWDSITLAMRGTIIDGKGKVVASSFKKFFNFEEVEASGQIPQRGDYVYVQEKLDGSLGILFYYEEEWHLATKGSFVSEQAKRGMDIIKSKFQLGCFVTEMTYLCEIIYPENRIVVDYGGKEDIIFIGATSDGEELHWTTAKSIFKASGIPEKNIVKTEQHFAFDTELYKSLKTKNLFNKEGFVLRFQPGNFRMKIKFEEYVRLHKLLTNFSNLDIWEALKQGKNLEKEILNKVPDEFDFWVKNKIEEIRGEFSKIEKEALDLYEIYTNSQETQTTKAEYSKWVQTQEKSLRPILYSIFDGKDYDKSIWRIIRPEYQKPFWEKNENS
jgi:RNA ligase